MVIIGAFVSEGHTYHGEKYGNGSYCQITQDENTKLYKNIIKALDSLQWKYNISYDPRKPNIKWIRFGTNQCWVEYFDILFGKGSKNKHLPDWFRTLPESFLNIIIHNLYLGDGSHNTTRNEKYLSISKKLLDEIQEIFILLGKNGTVNYDEHMPQKCYFEESHRDSWIVSRKKHINIIPYSGKVYCTSTKSGIICIRYKGQTCWCGNCYKSEDKITENSATDFVNRMVKSKHLAMCEHGTVYLKFKWWQIHKMIKYGLNKYSKGFKNVTTNYRVIIENKWDDDLKYICDPTPKHHLRVTVKFNTSLGIAIDIVRHRVFSFAGESTRYCNYSKSKFGSEILFIKPYWFDTATKIQQEEFKRHCQQVEDRYIALVGKWVNKRNGRRFSSALKENPLIAQEARDVLSMAVKTELIMTGFISDWKHFFNLRVSTLAVTGMPHKDLCKLSDPLYETFKDFKYI
jgi:thymidylate synthase (FAD)